MGNPVEVPIMVMLVRGEITARIYRNWAGRWVVLQKRGRVKVFDCQLASMLFAESLGNLN